MQANELGRVGVLCGGISTEREISLVSGREVFTALTNSGIDTVLIDWKKDNSLIELIQNSKVDVIFIALHGKGGEDGMAQAILNIMQIPYTGSGVTTSALLIDKILTKHMLKGAGFATPDFVILNSSSDIDYAIEKLGLPMVIKPNTDGSSYGISIAKNEKEVMDAYEKAKQFNEGVFAEAYVKGDEITVGILGDTILPSINIVVDSGFYDYEAKYLSNTTKYICPGVSSKELEQAIGKESLRAYQVSGCRGWGRIDGMLDKNGVFYIIELNTVPGLTPTSLVPKACKHMGISFSDMLLSILATAQTD